VSRYEARLVKEQFGSNSLVIQNGIAEDTFQYNWNPPSDGLVLTYAGRLERYKRVHILIEAASILLRRKHEVTVRIIGDGPELSNLLRLSSRLGVKVQHFHFLRRREYLGLLSTSSFFVNPSRYEAFSIVVAEAKTIGLPVVVSMPWGEIFKDLPNVSLVDGNSPHEIAEAISKTVDLRREESKSFMSWNEVTNRLVREVYIPSLNRS
jgi:glycosyltransferase involved in cell wall biosynthesis